MQVRFDPRTDVVQAFPTPVYTFRLDGGEPLNAALKALILKSESEHPGVRRSNLGGWHSAEDFLEWPDRAVGVLRQAFLGAIRAIVPHTVGRDCRFDVQLAGWANVLRRGGMNKRHVHPGNQISLVYYVEAGAPAPANDPDSGVFELLDPRQRADLALLPGFPGGESLLIQPANGLMIGFASWMYHQVNPYRGDGERISIAVNAHVSNLQVVEAAVGPRVDAMPAGGHSLPGALRA